MKSVLSKRAYLFLLILLGAASSINAQSDNDSAILIAQFTDPKIEWTTTVYFLDLESRLPLPGTIAGSGYTIYEGAWAWTILKGVTWTEASMETYFWDVDGDDINEIIVVFSDLSNIWGEINRISIDSDSYTSQLQEIELPNIIWSFDQEPMDFNPLERKEDGTIIWKMGPSISDSAYQVAFSPKDRKIELNLVSPRE